jgi:hypothetical protein
MRWLLESAKTLIQIRSATLRQAGFESCSTGGMKAARAIWQNGVAVNMSRPPALDRAAIDANDQSEPSSPDPVTSQSAPRSQRGRRGI